MNKRDHHRERRLKVMPAPTTAATSCAAAPGPFGDDISTDQIAPGRLFHLRTDLPELAKHVLEDENPEFAKRLKPGDFVVGGRNFGLGSSREHAPRIIKLAGARGGAGPVLRAHLLSQRDQRGAAGR